MFKALVQSGCREIDFGVESGSQTVLNKIGKGTTVKKKEDTHKMAEANKAFAHYRW